MIDKNYTFVPTDKHGNEVPMDEYLKFATLSPWVPCPDPVARRALDVAKVGPEDVHYELGSGDGRLNFHAIDPSSYGVKKSVGVDIDASLVDQANRRKMKIHPAPQNLEFICADLMDVKKTNSHETNTNTNTNTNANTNEVWKMIQSECTVMTMYFVEDALIKLKPLLEKYLLGSKCRIVTVGYEMKGWEPKWAESILGLTVHLYDMENLDMLYNRSHRNADQGTSIINSGAEVESDIHADEEDIDDEQLNMLSRKKLAAMEDEEDHNPFKENVPTPSKIDHSEEENTDFHWDFDEHAEYDEEGELVLDDSSEKKDNGK